MALGEAGERKDDEVMRIDSSWWDLVRINWEAHAVSKEVENQSRSEAWKGICLNGNACTEHSVFKPYTLIFIKSTHPLFRSS